MRLVHCLVGLFVIAIFTGCRTDGSADDYVVRIGDSYLTETAIRDRLARYSALTDTVSAREHIIDRWITRQLLYREAERKNLAEQPEVQEQLADARRSVLITALVEDVKQDVPDPSEASIRRYYQRHAPQLRLQEPYLQVRYINIPDRSEAEHIRERLLNAPDSTAADSIWERAVGELAADRERARRLSRNYLPVSRLRRELPLEGLNLSGMEVGTVTRIVENNSTFHLLQIADRLEEQTLPPLEHIRDQIIQQLIIQEKKLMYTREVERLRTRARANNSLEIREQR